MVRFPGFACLSEVKPTPHAEGITLELDMPDPDPLSPAGLPLPSRDPWTLRLQAQAARREWQAAQLQALGGALGRALQRLGRWLAGARPPSDPAASPSRTARKSAVHGLQDTGTRTCRC